MVRGTNRRRAVNTLAPLFFSLVLLVGWLTFTAVSGVEAWRLPSPQAVAVRAVDMFSERWMWERVVVTASEAILGCLLGLCAALPLSWMIHRVDLVRAAVEPFLGATQALPAIAVAPLIVLWMGYGTWAIATLCALMVFFPILVSTVVGLRHLDPEVMEAAELDGARGWTLVWRVEAPLAAPSILAGVRTGFTLSVTGAVVGEMVMGGSGLGEVLVQARTSIDTASMFVTIFTLCVMATSIYVAVRQLEKRIRLDFPSQRKKSS